MNIKKISNRSEKKEIRNARRTCKRPNTKLGNINRACKHRKVEYTSGMTGMCLDCGAIGARDDQDDSLFF